MPNPLANVPKPVLITGAVVAVGAAAYVMYRRKHEAAAVSTAPSDAAYGASAYGYGYGYGLAQGYPYQDYYGYAYGAGSLGGLGPFGVGPSQPPIGTIAPVSTNAQWAQAAETYFSNNGIYDPTTAAAALGKYITGGTLSSAQEGIVSAAIAVEGYPPVAGANNYPPNMHSSPPTGQKPGGPAPVKWTKKISVGGPTYPLDIYKVASNNHTTESLLVAHNLQLAPWVGKKKIGKKMTIVVPA